MVKSVTAIGDNPDARAVPGVVSGCNQLRTDLVATAVEFLYIYNLNPAGSYSKRFSP